MFGLPLWPVAHGENKLRADCENANETEEGINIEADAVAKGV